MTVLRFPGIDNFHDIDTMPIATWLDNHATHELTLTSDDVLGMLHCACGAFYVYKRPVTQEETQLTPPPERN